MQIFGKIAQGFEKKHYLCSGLGEKSRVADALAFISHFTEKTSEIYYGISSIEKQRESRKRHSIHNVAMHTPYGVEHS